MNRSIRKLYNVLVVGGALAAAGACQKPAGKSRTPASDPAPATAAAPAPETEPATAPVTVSDPGSVSVSGSGSVTAPVTESAAMQTDAPVAPAAAPVKAKPARASHPKKAAPAPAPVVAPEAGGIRGWGG